MTREKLLHDLVWIRGEMDRRNPDRMTPPPIGTALLNGRQTLDMIHRGQIASLSRRYIDAIIAELDS